MSVAALRLLPAVAALAACGPGDLDVRTGDAYVPPGGAYRIRYPAPPWRLVEAEGEGVRLQVQSPFVDGEDGLVYDLTVDLGGGAAARRAARELDQARARGETALEDFPPEIVAATGDVGVQVVVQERSVPLRFRRSVFFDRPGGGTLRVVVRSLPFPPDDAELDALLRAFEVRGAP